MLIRKLDETDFPGYVQLQGTAYPGFYSIVPFPHQEMEERFIQLQKEDPIRKFYGVFQDGGLVGGMQLYDFTLRFHDTRIPLGGIGSVATDFLHKKKKVAKEIITFFINHYRSKEYVLAALHPFRPDFYKKMGFGYGTKTNLYRVKPESLPHGHTKQNLRFCTKQDIPLLVSCHNRVSAKTHGMIEQDSVMMERFFRDPGIRVIGYGQDGQLRGYVAFKFVPEPGKSPMIYDMEIIEMIYETPAATQELFSCLHSQSDQVRSIYLHTQDESFHYLLADPRNGTENLLPCIAHECNKQGLGIMYRVINIKGIFQVLREHDFGHQSCKLRIDVEDNFYPANSGAVILHCNCGRATVSEENDYEVAMSLNIGEFSSLLMGAVTVKQLCRHGLAVISDQSYLEIINQMFMVEEKPVCTVRF
ncbi:MAG TPA: GNAT family N-acetyltransferase [Methylomusa anaerophila]|uniref:N-acetyltransferase domain-containing protein n=1 Tax=Methylomusa anaerophila TaxID=1930071 RepID=A0A348AF50_9FIRM|nr:GNAT family N-acetyltransferase [Methylomusa anaerophila]BBB89698.1 hypothetical protein MAMMFC1_00331 [Methylomusa anaerophila]HML89258.1 GNAT family N-acetyltransferase [Methylomusa anaerophila]